MSLSTISGTAGIAIGNSSKLTTGNGSLTVTAAGGTLSTGHSAALTATNASLTLDNQGTASTTLISIGAGSQIVTAGASGQNVIIFVGSSASPPGPTNAGVAPVGVKYSPTPATSPPFYFGTTNAPTTGTISVVTPAGIEISSINGADVIFSTGTFASTAIRVTGNTAASPTLIQADPIVTGAMTTNQSPLGSAISNPTNILQSGSPSAGLAPAGGALPAYAPIHLYAPVGTGNSAGISSMPTSNAFANAILQNAESASGNIPVSGVSSLSQSVYAQPQSVNAFNNAFNAATQSRFSVDSALAEQEENSTRWISETELGNGQIPAALQSELKLGITGSTESIRSKFSSSLLSNSSESAKQVLGKGSVLLAPTEDSTIQTAFGKIKVNAGALVLVLSTSNGTAVYDLDDRHRSSVTVIVGDDEIDLAPGASAMVTSSRVKSFEEVNPAQLFSYRNIRRSSAGAAHHVFTSEFNVPLAIQTVVPLKQILSSNHPNAKRLAAHLLKTTAANLQVRRSGAQFQQLARPSVTAWAP
jgi:hypothetical protein